jgi:hypothetical protein
MFADRFTSANIDNLMMFEQVSCFLQDFKSVNIFSCAVCLSYILNSCAHESFHRKCGVRYSEAVR